MCKFPCGTHAQSVYKWKNNPFYYRHRSMQTCKYIEIFQVPGGVTVCRKLRITMRVWYCSNTRFNAKRRINSYSIWNVKPRSFPKHRDNHPVHKTKLFMQNPYVIIILAMTPSRNNVIAHDQKISKIRAVAAADSVSSHGVSKHHFGTKNTMVKWSTYLFRSFFSFEFRSVCFKYI